MSDDRELSPIVIREWKRYMESYLKERVATLFDAIAHGSPDYRTWLKKAIEDHFAGRRVESYEEARARHVPFIWPTDTGGV